MESDVSLDTELRRVTDLADFEPEGVPLGCDRVVLGHGKDAEVRLCEFKGSADGVDTEGVQLEPEGETKASFTFSSGKSLDLAGDGNEAGHFEVKLEKV